MKISEILNTRAAAYVGVAAVGVLVLWWIGRKAAASGSVLLDETVGLVNPADSRNLVNRAVTTVGSAVSQDSNWTLGGWIYDLTHPAYDPNAPVRQESAPVSWLDVVKMGGK